MKRITVQRIGITLLTDPCRPMINANEQQCANNWKQDEITAILAGSAGGAHTCSTSEKIKIFTLISNQRPSAPVGPNVMRLY